MTEILRVFESVYQLGVEYCVICLRSSQERRMVNMKNLENFIYSINFPYSYIDKCQKICYICERQAVGAHRFRLAVNLSASVHTLFTLMAKSKKTHTDVLDCISGNRVGTGIVRNVNEWENRLKLLRSQTQLLPTEVLTVNSLVGENVSPGESADIYVIPDAAPREPSVEQCSFPHPPALQRQPTLEISPLAPRVAPGADAPPPDAPDAPPRPPPALQRKPSTESHVTEAPKERDIVHDVLSEPEIYMDSVIILDEEDPIDIKFEEPGPGEVVIEDNFMRNSPRPESPDIYPSHILPNAPDNVPNTQMIPKTTQLVPIDTLIESQNTTNLALVGDEMQIMQRNPIEPTNFLLHPIIENNGVVSVPSLSAQIVNGQLIRLDNSNIVIQTPKIALQNGSDFDILTDPSQVANILKGINGPGNITVVSADIPINDLGHNVLQSIQNLRSNQNFGDGSFQVGNFVVQNSVSNNSIHNVLVQGSGQSASNSLSAAQTEGILFQYLEKHRTMPQINPTHSQGVNKEISHVASIVIEDDSQSSDNVSTETNPRNVPTAANRKRCSGSENTKRRRDEEESQKTEAPPVSQKETDWEDKIPMDVISFMDATDPNAASVLRPPETCVIYKVHSAGDEDVHSIQNVHSQAEVDSASVDVDAQKGLNPSENVHSESERVFKRSVHSKEVVKCTGQSAKSVKKTTKPGVQPVSRNFRFVGDSVTSESDSKRSGKRKKTFDKNVGVSEFIDLSD